MEDSTVSLDVLFLVYTALAYLLAKQLPSCGGPAQMNFLGSQTTDLWHAQNVNG